MGMSHCKVVKFLSQRCFILVSKISKKSPTLASAHKYLPQTWVLQVVSKCASTFDFSLSEPSSIPARVRLCKETHLRTRELRCYVITSSTGAEWSAFRWIKGSTSSKWPWISHSAFSKNTTKMSFGKEMTCFSFLEVNQKFKTILPDQILIYFYLLLGTGAGLYVLITNFVYQVSSRHVHKFLSVLRLSQNWGNTDEAWWFTLAARLCRVICLPMPAMNAMNRVQIKMCDVFVKEIRSF